MINSGRASDLFDDKDFDFNDLKEWVQNWLTDFW